ncbi:MAG: hypothetical protein ACM359_22580 [Bacillota bacterium]
MGGSTQQQEAQRCGSYQVTPVCWIFWIVAAIVVIGLEVSTREGRWWASKDSGEFIGYLLGTGFGLLAIPALIGWAVFNTFRRSQRGGSAAFLIVLMLCTFGTINRLAEQHQGRQVSAAMDDLTRQVKADLTKQLAEDNSPEKLLEVSSSNLDRMKQAASQFKGEAATLTEIGVALVERAKAADEEYVKVSKRLETAEVLNPFTLKIREQIDERKALLREFLQANQKLRSVILGANSFVRGELSRRGVSAAAAKGFMTGFERKQARMLPLLQRLRDKDDELGKATLEILDLWESQWGNWQCNQARHTVEFQNQQAADRYNALTAQIQKTIDEQSELQKQVAQRL